MDWKNVTCSCTKAFMFNELGVPFILKGGCRLKTVACAKDYALCKTYNSKDTFYSATSLRHLHKNTLVRVEAI